MYFFQIKNIYSSFAWITLLGAIILPLKLQGGHKEVKNIWPAYVSQEDLHPEADDTECELCCIGPLWSSHTRNGVEYNTFRPFFTIASNRKEGRQSAYFLYPLFKRHKSPHDVRWQGIIAKSRYPNNPDDLEKKRIFMIYDYQKPGQDARAKRSLFPISGRIDHFMGNDTVSWTLFPLWLQSAKNGENRYAFLWPFIHWQKGETSGGGSFWPLRGHTWKTDSYDHQYWLWPLIFSHKNNLDQETPWIKHGFLPFYSYEHSATLESKTWLWPFFGYTQKKDPDYYETRLLWPIFVQARGSDKNINRWAPFYTHSQYKNTDKKWYCWPFIKRKDWDHSEKNLSFQQRQFLFFFVWTHRQQSLDDPQKFNAHKIHVWPFLSHWNNGNGQKQIQMLSPLEPFFQHNEVIRELYSPLFALFRYSEKGPDHHMASFCFNLITYERSPHQKEFTLGPLFCIKSSPQGSGFQILRGLLGFHRYENKKTLKLFWFSV